MKLDNSLKLDAVKSINDWSKLLISLNAGMGGGCLTILQNSAAQGMTRTFLVAAILAFVTSMLFSVLLMGQVLVAFTSMSEDVPTVGNVYKSRDGMSGLAVKVLSRLQIITFSVACILLGIWVALKLT